MYVLKDMIDRKLLSLRNKLSRNNGKVHKDDLLNMSLMDMPLDDTKSNRIGFYLLKY